jgi:hypothetical protein
VLRVASISFFLSYCVSISNDDDNDDDDDDNNNNNNNRHIKSNGSGKYPR